MGITLGIASLKGGVGKTTLAAGVSRALVSLGKKVLVVDCKYGGTLDIEFGCQDSVLFNLSDVCTGCNFSRIFVESDGVMFCSAPADKENVNENLKYLLSTVNDFDYIILDEPPEFSLCDRVLIITTTDDSAVRCAEICGAECKLSGIETSLILNKLPLFEGVLTNGGEIIDRTYSQLIGAIPFMWGYTPKERATMYSCVYKNIALRIEGNFIPLFDGLKNKKKMQSMIR